MRGKRKKNIKPSPDGGTVKAPYKTNRPSRKRTSEANRGKRTSSNTANYDFDSAALFDKESDGDQAPGKISKISHPTEMSSDIVVNPNNAFVVIDDDENELNVQVVQETNTRIEEHVLDLQENNGPGCSEMGSNCDSPPTKTVDTRNGVVNENIRGRTRRCFPTFYENNNEDNSDTAASNVYSSEFDKFIVKKDKLQNGLKNFQSLISDEESSDDEPKLKQRTSPHKTVQPSITTDSQQPSTTNVVSVEDLPEPKKARKRPKMRASLKKLYNHLDLLVSEQETVQSSLDTSLTEDLVAVDESLTSEPRKIFISIKYRTKVLCFHLSSNEQFCKLLPDISSKIGEPAEHINLFLEGTLLNLFKTPQDVNFKLGAFIDCLVSSKNGNNTDAISIDAADVIELKIQSKLDRKKVSLKCNKLEPLQKVLERYATMKNLNLEQLHLEFDGEMVALTESPNDVDMEDGDCVDVIIHSS